MKNPLPCPFCGGEVAVGEQKPIPPCTESRFRIQCFGNECEIWPETRGVHTTEDSVIAAWNKRKE